MDNRFKELGDSLHINRELLIRFDVQFISASVARLKLRNSYVDYDYYINKTINKYGTAEDLNTLLSLVGEKLYKTFNLKVYKIVQTQFELDNEMDVDYNLILTGAEYTSQLVLYYGSTPMGNYVVSNQCIQINEDYTVDIKTHNLVLKCRFAKSLLVEEVDALKKVLEVV